MNDYLQYVVSVANSNFTTSLLGAVAGAFSGAFAAQKIVERGNVRKELSTEISAVRSMVYLSYAAFDTMVAMKSQHIKPITDEYFKGRNKLMEDIYHRKNGRISKEMPISIKINFTTLHAPEFHFSYLEKNIMENIHSDGVDIRIFNAIKNTSKSISSEMKLMNDIINSWKQNTESIGKIDEKRYFGINDGQGNTDTTYFDIMVGLREQVDDGIFFLKALALRLERRSSLLIAEFERKFGQKFPNIAPSGKIKEELQPLMPDLDRYADWLSEIKVEKRDFIF